MSWSVSASGKPEVVKAALAVQFKYPLDEKNGLSDAGERETVYQISETLAQICDTFDPEKPLTVSASGHISFDDRDAGSGARQEVHLDVRPG